MLNGHHQIGKVGCTIDLVAIHSATKVVGVGVALGGLGVAGVNPIAIRELNLVVTGTRTRHLHVVAELVLEGEDAGLGIALLSVLLNGGAGANTLLDLIGNLVKDLFD